MGRFKGIIQNTISLLKSHKLVCCFLLSAVTSAISRYFLFKFWAVEFSFISIFFALWVGYDFFCANKLKNKEQTIWSGLLDYGSRLVLLTIGAGLLFEFFIPVLDDILDKNIQHWDFNIWKYIVLIIGGLGTLGAAIGQLENSRRTLAETQTNNLAKLFTEETERLVNSQSNAEKLAALSLLELAAVNSNYRFYKAVMESLIFFLHRRYRRKGISQKHKRILAKSDENIGYKTLCLMQKITISSRAEGGKKLLIKTRKEYGINPDNLKSGR